MNNLLLSTDLPDVQLEPGSIPSEWLLTLSVCRLNFSVKRTSVCASIDPADLRFIPLTDSQEFLITRRRWRIRHDIDWTHDKYNHRRSGSVRALNRFSSSSRLCSLPHFWSSDGHVDLPHAQGHDAQVGRLCFQSLRSTGHVESEEVLRRMRDSIRGYRQARAA